MLDNPKDELEISYNDWGAFGFFEKSNQARKILQNNQSIHR